MFLKVSPNSYYKFISSVNCVKFMYLNVVLFNLCLLGSEMPYFIHMHNLLIDIFLISQFYLIFFSKECDCYNCRYEGLQSMF